jgi:methionyl-tRNA synthetase
MSKSFDRFTVTAALPYANGPLHIGHISGAYLPADIYVRYMRATGKEVLFVCGTDEHGAAITIRAAKEGTTPQALVDKYHESIKSGFEQLNISFDVFSRTSRKVHHDTALEFFLKFHNEGKLERKHSQQLYDEQAGMFLADRFVKGTCPRCCNPNAYGDQCERCGSSLNATDLYEPVSTITGTKPVMKETLHWFFPLDQYQQRIEDYILGAHSDWKSNVFGQCRSWIKDGLQPRAITRDLDWGIKIPVEGGEGKVLYVWFDAPIGYISATKEWAEQHGKDWRPWWQDKKTALIHFIGKDNIVFHCIIFPAMLMGHGDYILPENVPGNEFLNLEGNKISTSRNYAVWVHEYCEDFPGKADLLRYVLAATMPEQKDNDFSWEGFKDRVNNELVAAFGNFVNRIVKLTEKNFASVVQEPRPLGEKENTMFSDIRDSAARMGTAIEGYRFREALTELMNIASAGNKYLAETEPWHVLKTDLAAGGAMLNAGAQVCALLSIACAPFLPDTAQKLRRIFALPEFTWADLQRTDLVPAGTTITDIGLLFEKVEDEVIAAQKEKLAASLAASVQQQQNTSNAPAAKAETTFDAFQAMDLRVVTIIEAERVPNADKLLKLKVDTGLDTRTVISGVAEHFAPEDLLCKQALCLLNLAPRKIRGVESQGMLLFAENSEGKLMLVGPGTRVPPGSQVK